VSGHLTSDTTWNVETVYVIDDIVVDDSFTLTIKPGVRIEFQGYFGISINGRLLAIGLPEKPILFTIDNPQGFTLDEFHAGSWNGIRFENTKSTNETSIIKYCRIEYSKATDNGAGYTNMFDLCGGAISLYNFSKLEVSNSIIENNLAEYGGAICCFYNSSPIIKNNIIDKNYALTNGSAIANIHSYPKTFGNTVVDNYVLETAPYYYKYSIHNFISKPAIVNNIIRDNPCLPDQIWGDKEYYTSFNNIEGYAAVNSNIDLDPMFIDKANSDYHLLYTSPCVNKGDSGTYKKTDLDFEGDTRIADGSTDIGADEFTSHLYTAGDKKSGSVIVINITGIPGSTPIGIWFSIDLLDPPFQSKKFGEWYLENPIYGPLLLPQIPSNGVATVSGPLPPTPSGPYTIVLQSIIGNKLSNYHLLNVK